MAIIKTSAIVSDIKGTAGGNVFASNKGGNYLRRYKKPTNRNSEKQQVVRSAFGAMTGLWRQLTELQRSSWNEGAVNFPMMNKLGEAKVLSGQQLFNKLNNNLVQAGQATLSTCPIPQSFPSVEFTNVQNITTGNVLNFTLLTDGGVNVPNGFVLVVSATASLSAGINSPQKGLFKNIALADSGDSIEDYEISTPYNNNFGALITGDTIFIGAYLVNTISGEASSMSTLKTTRQAV